MVIKYLLTISLKSQSLSLQASFLIFSNSIGNTCILYFILKPFQPHYRIWQVWSLPHSKKWTSFVPVFPKYRDCIKQILVSPEKITTSLEKNRYQQVEHMQVPNGMGPGIGGGGGGGGVKQEIIKKSDETRISTTGSITNCIVQSQAVTTLVRVEVQVACTKQRTTKRKHHNHTHRSEFNQIG